MPVPPQDSFRWQENQRVYDLHTLVSALRQAANKFRKRETETPKEPYSLLKCRALDDGEYTFKADVTFWNKDHAILVWDEIAAQLSYQTSGIIGDAGTWSLTVSS